MGKAVAPSTLPADFNSWDEEKQDSTVAQKQSAALTKRVANAPTWQEAVFPNLTAATQAGSQGPISDLAGLKAGFKDIAALPMNLLTGILATGDQGGLSMREAMASKQPGSESQNQRVVGGLALAGTALGGPVLRMLPEAVPAIYGSSTLRNIAEFARPILQNTGRQVAAGVAESVPAAAYQTATGDVGGGIANLALGGALRPLTGIPKAAPAAADIVERTAGALSGVPGHELAAIGPFGMSKYGREVADVAKNQSAAYDLGQKLADRIKNFDQYLPNAESVDEMVKNLPPVKAKAIVEALENSKTAIRIKGTKGEKTTGLADVFESTKSAGAKSGSAPSYRDVTPASDQSFTMLDGPKDVIPFVSVAKGSKAPISGLLGMDEKGLPAIRRNPQVIPDAEPIGQATYTQTTKGAKGRDVHALPENVATDAKIDQVISLLKQTTDKDGNIPAYVARMVKQQYDKGVGDAWGKETSAYIDALKQGRHAIAKALEDAADQSGIPEYKQAMQDYTRRLSAVDKISGRLGATDETRRAGVESFVSNLYGKNKTQQQKNLADLSDILGEDFAQQAKAIGTAKAAMPGGSLAILPTHTTGRSLLGAELAGGAGHALGSAGAGYAAIAGLPFAALSSPMLASGAIGATRGLANLATSPVGQGATLASLAGLRSYLQAENAGK